MAGAASLDRPSPLRRSFVTPEGVDLRLKLAGAGVRAAAYLIDFTLLVTVLLGVTIVLMIPALADKSGLILALWLLGAFLLRNLWFVLFEMGRRGATPGKRMMGIRVVARDGVRLTARAVIARNAMREVEVFLPLSFLGAQAGEGGAGTLATIAALLWSGIFLFFPLLNRDRLRVGDLIGGTWVVVMARDRLGRDLAATEVGARHFDERALDLYGIYELQTLEEIVRDGRPETVAAVAATIRAKAGLEDGRESDQAFLEAYYAALCARLERKALLGRRRADKFDGG